LPWRLVTAVIIASVISIFYTPIIWRIAAASFATALFIASVLWYINQRPESVIALTNPRLYYEKPGDKCYSGLVQSNASITLSGETDDWDFVSCQYEAARSMQGPAPAPPSRSYIFNLDEYQGQQIVDFRGKFGIDEEDSDLGNLEHDGARAEWRVSVAGRDLCSVDASWQSPGECVVDTDYTIQPNQTLVIKETLIDRGAHPDRRLWLGIAKPRLVLRR
jgi:hypothetical protein